MKVIYNNKEVLNTNNDYNKFLNLPMINSKPLQGNISLSDINTYTKTQIDELIANTRSIETVTSLPVNLIENTLYYVGPDSEDIYEVYLVDEVRNVIKIGTSQFGEYFGGTAIDIDDDNYIYLKIDNKTVLVDSENNLHANLSMDAVPVMVGATSSADGEKGVVPQPKIGDQNKSLKGTGVWQNLMNRMYPINSIYITYDNTTDPNNFIPSTHWVRFSEYNALWTTNVASGEWTLTSQMPKFTANRTLYGHQPFPSNGTGVFNGSSIISYNEMPHGEYNYIGTMNFDASRSWPGYKNDQTIVQPKAIKICLWRRDG